MGSRTQAIADRLSESLGNKLENCQVNLGEVTIEIQADNLLAACRLLRSASELEFCTLIDVCGVDYRDYGKGEWQTDSATSTGFGRGVDPFDFDSQTHEAVEDGRFAVIYHLLSVDENTRLRIRVFADGNPPRVPSVVDIWPAANWFEREAFDLYGILFEGHPDLRRILTDYGFVGHPFRKDFPLIGNVEARYDAERQRVVYEPVSIEPRVLVPKVIREDSRYLHPEAEGEDNA